TTHGVGERREHCLVGIPLIVTFLPRHSYYLAQQLNIGKAIDLPIDVSKANKVVVATYMRPGTSYQIVFLFRCKLANAQGVVADALIQKRRRYNSVFAVLFWCEDEARVPVVRADVVVFGQRLSIRDF